MKNDIRQKLNTGLTSEQVRERISQGLVNMDVDIKTKSYKKIITDNLFTLFNLVNVLLLVCIIISGSYKNGLFFLIVLWNFMIGTIQEIRAKRIYEKLSLLSSPKVYARRDSVIHEIQVNEIVLGEIMELNAGSQVCADAVVLDGFCLVNESHITGESVSISKKPGDELLSGSFLVSGKVAAECVHVGNDNFVNKITKDAAYYRKPDSVIMKSLHSMVKWIVIFIIPLTGLFVWNNFFRLNLEFSSAMVKTVAAVSSMIPGGLILLVSAILTVSVVRLSMHNTMVQDLYSVENLARVDTLLLDKTGTITEGVMHVDEVLEIDSDKQPLKWMKIFAAKSTDHNPTIEAIRSYLENCEHNEEESEGLVFIPFSSEKKLSMLVVPGKGTFILGAPEFVLGEKLEKVQEMYQPYANKGKRVVVFVYSDICPDTTDLGNVSVPENIKTIAFVVIGDRIRKDAPQTLEFFRNEGVEIKIVSGDSPITVSGIAREAGLEKGNEWVDASLFQDEKSLSDAVEKYTVFGRVTPYQKRTIVKSLQEKGHVVAMTGDGANDVLALKEANCSIAMQNGADAARNASNLVLLDSSFSSLPLVVAEGRKAINNLQRSAVLYLTKTVYSMILTALFIIISSITYPFESIQITLLGAVSIAVPSFFLALEPNTKPIEKGFLRNVALIAVPTGIMEASALILFLLLAQNIKGSTAEMLSSGATYMMIIFGLVLIVNICGRINIYKCILIVALVIGAALACILFPGLFSLVPLNSEVWRLVILISAVFFILHVLLFRIILPLVKERKIRNEKH